MTTWRTLQSGISTQVSMTAISLPMGSARLSAFGGSLPSFGDQAFAYQASIIVSGTKACDHLEGNQSKYDFSKRDDNANPATAFSIEGRKTMEGVLRYKPQ